MNAPIPDTLSAYPVPGEYDRYMLRSRAEVFAVLRGLYERVSQITVFFNEGRDMLITTLAAVEDDHVVLDYGPSSEMNRKALDADKHFCVTTLDKVRVQFILHRFEKIEFGGRPAFRAAPPKELLRLQRREFYRLVTPILRPLRCQMTIPPPDPQAEPYRHTAQVFDISGGGVGIGAPPETVPFAIDLHCPFRIELPEVGVVEGKLRVRNLFEIVLKSGARVRRAGCEFVNLPGPMLTLIQRYIIKVERERKARESGLL